MLKTEDTIQFLIEELEKRGFEVVYKEEKKDVRSA